MLQYLIIGFYVVAEGDNTYLRETTDSSQRYHYHSRFL